jgi:hypothetical protein
MECGTCWKMCYYMLMFQIDGRDNLILMMVTRFGVLTTYHVFTHLVPTTTITQNDII